MDSKQFMWISTRTDEINNVAFLLMLAYVVVYAFHEFWNGFSFLLDIILLLGIVLLGVQFVSQRDIRLGSKQWVAVGLAGTFAVTSLAAGVLAPDTPGSLTNLTPIFGGVLFFSLMQGTIRSRTRVENVLSVVAIVSALLAGLSVLNALGVPIPTTQPQPKTVFGETFRRYGPVGISNPEGFAIFSSFGAVLWLRRSTLSDTLSLKLAQLAPVVVCGLGVAVALSRGGFVVFFAVIISYIMGYLIYWRGVSTPIKVLLAAVPLSLLLGIGLLIRLAMDPLSDVANSYYDRGVPRELIGNIASRLDILSRGIELFFQYPLTGGGPGYFDAFTGINAHSTYVSLLVNNGIFVFSVFMTLVLYIILKISKKLNSENKRKAITAIAVFSGVVGLLIGISTYPAHLSTSQVVWLIFGIAVAAVDQKENIGIETAFAYISNLLSRTQADR